MFLKRTTPPERLTMGSFTLGATVVVNAKPLKIIDYADDISKARFAFSRGSILIIIKPECYKKTGEILNKIYESGLDVGRMRLVRFSEDESREFYNLSGRSNISNNDILHLITDRTLAIEVTGDDILSRAHELAGPADPQVARDTGVNSLRALYGKDRIRNAVYVSLTLEGARQELDYVFERKYPFTGTYSNCSLCIIKPHAVTAKAAGHVIDRVLNENMEISALRSINLTRSDAADYLEAYRGVCHEYEQWIVELTSGPAVVMEIRDLNNNGDTVEMLREIAGPYDPSIARILRTHSLRAIYGNDSVRNALHVTDLPADGPLECKFFFHVLADVA